jgi:DNA uptake protein ComE-like DNA-binding protein
MNRKSTFISLILLCMIALAACSTATSTSTTSTTDSNSSSSAQSVDPSNVAKVNLNTASADDFLAAVPGLGNRMVREFMEYRPYISIQQFRSETLQQIPGLSADEAGSLISARPFASTDAFLTKLSQYISTDELEIAKMYLGGNG